MLFFKIDVDQNGQIQYMDATLYANDGLTSNENENGYSTSAMINCYDSSRWKVDSFASITDGPTNCFMRAPGKIQCCKILLIKVQLIFYGFKSNITIIYLYLRIILEFELNTIELI